MSLRLALVTTLLASSAYGQVRLSSLPAAAALMGSELIPVVQGGVNAVTTPAAIKTFTGGGGGGSPGGSAGQLQYNNAGVFGGFALGGDCTLSQPAIACTKTNGIAFAASATTDATNAANISVGILPSGRLNGSYGGITGVGTLASLAAGSVNVSGLTPTTNVCSDGADNLTSVCTNTVALANLAQIGANTVLGNGTGGAANVTALATTGSGSVVEATSPTLVTPVLGAATATTLNGDTFTAGTYTLTGGAAKTLTFNNTMTLAAGADSQTFTFPAATATIAGLGTTQTFTGNDTFNAALILSTGGPGVLQINSEKVIIGTAPTAPTITGGGATVTKNTGSASQKYTVTGTPSAATITLAMPAATNGYVCDGVDVTAGTRLQETTDSATAPVLTNYSPTGTATNFSSGDILLVKCVAY